MPKQRLTKTDWILAAFRALATGGPAALKVEPIARSIGSTKGSFYWHFEGPTALRDAMLSYWEASALTRIIDQLDPLPPGAARLRKLADLLDLALAEPHGGARGEPALRDWGRFDPVVAARVAAVDEQRIAYVAKCLTEAQLPTEPHARLLYAANLGLEALAADGGSRISPPVHALLDLYGVPQMPPGYVP
ncbi:TetR/AcrR family transcriptional regulator [Pontivivens insulae]|uniref:HTH tetR-type domain-containing protein n=1 Tax=Pontivivens insulae TaxID=1639689 RepID=A0A2R8AA20_9RHOB|nr:TetR/AcrR family transcriptional regulator [Pontivivens insulae]RED12817.1 TetR family transcriptional regulator [Pontivivens insulae]SPF28908.1 hypothetical protein POI8812_01211 [Pontivivens insulae]